MRKVIGHGRSSGRHGSWTQLLPEAGTKTAMSAVTASCQRLDTHILPNAGHTCTFITSALLLRIGSASRDMRAQLHTDTNVHCPCEISDLHIGTYTSTVAHASIPEDGNSFSMYTERCVHISCLAVHAVHPHVLGEVNRNHLAVGFCSCRSPSCSGRNEPESLGSRF